MIEVSNESENVYESYEIFIANVYLFKKKSNAHVNSPVRDLLLLLRVIFNNLFERNFQRN